MLFKKLKLKNIRSYTDLEITFPQGSILLSGDIGAGKTSVLLGLQFALFGLQPGQKGNSILRQGETNAYASLELDIDGNQIILERTIKKSNSGSISQDKNMITINGKSQELSTSEMKNKVISLLDYPKEFAKKSNLLYKFTVYTPQEEMKAIIQERPEIRLDTLRHIFGIDRYKRIKENAQILLQKIKESVKIKEVEISQINQLKEKLTLQTENKIKLAKEINNLNINLTNLGQQQNQAEEQLSKTRASVQEKQKIDYELRNKETQLYGKKELSQRLKKEIVSMQLQIKEKIDFSSERLQEVSNLLQKHKQILEEFNSKFMEINSQISVLNSRKEHKLELKDKVISLENCPTCFQTVGQEYKTKISKNTEYELNEIEEKLEPKIFEKSQAIKDIEKEKQLIQGYDSDKNELETNRIKFQHQKEIEIKIKSDAIILERTLQEIQELDNNILELKSKSQTFEQAAQEFEKANKVFDEINLKHKNLEITLAENNKELELLKIQLQETQDQIQAKEKIKSQINHLRGLQDWIEEKFLSLITLTETNVLAKLRSEFSQIFNEWFTVLVSESLTVRLDEDFTPIINNQDYEIDYDFLSGGERTAVALAYRLALNQVLNSMLSKIKTKDIVILDEPTDGFSDQQLDKMRDIFDQLNSEQIILVSHEQKIEGFVDNIIRIKKDGESFVEQQ